MKPKKLDPDFIYHLDLRKIRASKKPKKMNILKIKDKENYENYVKNLTNLIRNRM